MLKKIFKRSAQFIVLLLLVLAVVGVLKHQSLPDNSQRTVSRALPPNPDGLLVKHLLPQA